MNSRHLGAKHLRAIEKIGDCLCPGDESLPAFSKLGCISGIDRIADYMPEQDLKDLKTLLGVFAVMPQGFILLLLHLCELLAFSPGPWGVFRMVRVGLRGIVMSLYYGHPEVHRVIGYQVSVYRGQ